jgi:tetratricopeptide (TPR) repeat protein
MADRKKESRSSPTAPPTGKPAAVSPRSVVLAAFLLVVLGAAVYGNSFSGQFYLDDNDGIVRNASIRTLWPISVPLSPPPDTTLSGRPIVNLTLAINYAVSGVRPWSYHAFNLLVHLLAALTLFGIVRRTLLAPKMSARFARHSTVLSFLVAAVWTVHPLQTESVTYVVQRVESMMGLFYLLTIYCFIRGASSPRRSVTWYTMSVAACAAGMATKEVAVTAPVMAILYDRIFLSDAWKDVFRRRWKTYLGLAGTWIVLGVILASSPRSHSAGFNMPYITPMQYLSSQFGVMLHYLRLCFWPHPLILDYSLSLPKTSEEVILPAAGILALLLATVWALWKVPPAGYCGAWTFVILLPTSSIVPLLDLCFEHRMYLSLAGVISLTVCGTYAAGLWLSQCRPLPAARENFFAAAGLILSAAAVCGLGFLTLDRNAEYADTLVFQLAASQRAPENPRARVDLGIAYLDRNRPDEDLECFRQAVKLNPQYAPAYDNLALALCRKGMNTEAVEQAQAAIAAYKSLNPTAVRNELSKVYYHYGFLLDLLQRPQDALEQFRLSFELAPADAEKLTDYAAVLLKLDKPDEAAAALAEALRQEPRTAKAHYLLAGILLRQGRMDEAVESLQKSIDENPSAAEPHNLLGEAFVLKNMPADARREFLRAIELRDVYPEAHINLGKCEARRGDWTAAEKEFRRVTQLAPNSASAQVGLGMVLVHLHRPLEAVECYRRAVALENSPIALNQLAWLLAASEDDRARNPAEAAELARRACELTRNENPELLDTLAAAQAACGDYSAAVATAESAMALAQKAGKVSLATGIASRLELYKARKPYREGSGGK